MLKWLRIRFPPVPETPDPVRRCCLCGKPGPTLCARCAWVQDGKDNGR